MEDSDKRAQGDQVNRIFRGGILERLHIYKEQTSEIGLGVHLSIGLNTNLCMYRAEVYQTEEGATVGKL